MLTKQQIIDTFVAGINETPADELIEAYRELEFTQEQLDEVIRRNLAIKQEQAVWKQVDPIQS